jgi:predicted DNA-binding antitoxin AbrB/MazE fold protein
MALMRLVEAQYESGLLRPTRPLALRPGERVRLIVVRQPDPKRWDMARLAKTCTADESALTEQGLGNWSAKLDEEDRR